MSDLSILFATERVVQIDHYTSGNCPRCHTRDRVRVVVELTEHPELGGRQTIEEITCGHCRRVMSDGTWALELGGGR